MGTLRPRVADHAAATAPAAMGEHRKGGAVSGERPGVAWGATCGSKMAKKIISRIIHLWFRNVEWKQFTK
jgi:hypothetical protein